MDIVLEKISLLSPEEFSRLNEVLLSALRKGSFVPSHRLHAIEEASVALPVQPYGPALQGMQV